MCSCRNFSDATEISGPVKSFANMVRRAGFRSYNTPNRQRCTLTGFRYALCRRYFSWHFSFCKDARLGVSTLVCFRSQHGYALSGTDSTRLKVCLQYVCITRVTVEKLSILTDRYKHDCYHDTCEFPRVHHTEIWQIISSVYWMGKDGRYTYGNTFLKVLFTMIG